jgi:glucokinase
MSDRHGERPTAVPNMDRRSVAAGASDAHVVAVDLGGTWARAALFDPSGAVIRRARVGTDRDGGPARIVEQLATLIDEVAGRRSGTEVTPSVAVVGVPGVVNPDSGVVYSAANLADWRNVPLRRMLEERMALPCMVEHDAALAALAEYRRGAGRGCVNFAYVTVSTGIGAGLILNNQLYRGQQGTAGEFGHMVSIPNGPLCHCGNRGCLNAIASGDGIAAAAGAERAEDVAAAAAAGDVESCRVLIWAAHHLGLALGGLINLLALDAVALGGGVFAAGDLFWDTLSAAIAEGSWATPRAHCQIMHAELLDDAGLVGAYELAADALVGYEAQPHD